VSKSRGWPLLGPSKRLQYWKFWVSENYSSHKPLSGCIDIWYEATLGQGDASVYK